MAKKLFINSQMVGTTAGNTDYTNNEMSGVANVEDALDKLNERMKNVEGGDIDLGILNELFTSSGAQSGRWLTYRYAATNPAIGSTFDPTSFAPADSYVHCSFRVYKGDTLSYYQLAGGNGVPGFIITDLDNKVVYVSAKSTNDVPSVSGTYDVTADGYCYANGLPADNRAPYIYAEWHDRLTPKNKKGVLCVLGDSISTDDDAIKYPRILAQLLNCELDRRSQGGANLAATLGSVAATSYKYLRSDADIVTILYGANDSGMTDSVPVGTASEVMQIDISNESSLKSTFIGRYRLLITKIKARMAAVKNQKIVCIAPIPMQDSAREAILETMRSELSELVTLMGGSANGYYFINGKFCIPYSSALYKDGTHPNQAGDVILANTLFGRIRELK